MNILYLIIFVFIIVSIYYTLVVKKQNLETFISQNKYDSNIEKFSNQGDVGDEDEGHEVGEGRDGGDDFDYHDFLIKYSSINMTIKNVNDVVKIQNMIEKFKKHFYVAVVDSYVINANNIISSINNNLKETLRMINENKIKSPVYVMILFDKNKEGKEEENHSKYAKIVIFYPTITRDGNDKIDEFNKYFIKGDLKGSTLIYLLNDKNKINHHLE